MKLDLKIRQKVTNVYKLSCYEFKSCCSHLKTNMIMKLDLKIRQKVTNVELLLSKKNYWSYLLINGTNLNLILEILEISEKYYALGCGLDISLSTYIFKPIGKKDFNWLQLG